ncbi:Oidioi.mRNA.OKI2018_I69.XSR.g16848.t1.cds [Oikopleura dioica]|uniref:Oidioi.mRNA.OKI2018_I69.XSR.g16848.t1.cds n=1 Tax=Oikopleura dioica TaxID=34765 RepID=A0ABN7SHF0_OIKDI|nr:Oidioi.mRNA.OKI2018_I69.XSR.g16848.t1.cds [Oikopleura dioica]
MHQREEQVYQELYWNLIVALSGWTIVFAPALMLMLRSDRERSLDEKFIGITVERTNRSRERNNSRRLGIAWQRPSYTKDLNLLLSNKKNANRKRTPSVYSFTDSKSRFC